MDGRELRLRHGVKILAGAAILAAGLGLLIGLAIGPGRPREAPHAAEEGTIWTCSMHPQIQLPRPGKCPICGMDLIPLEKGDDEPGPILVMTPAAIELAEIRTAPAERKFVESEIRLVGKVAYDETRVKVISAWIPGRLDRLFVDYTGVRVKKGDHLVQLYSPEILSAQKELLLAARSVAELGSDASDAERGARLSTLESVRERLRLWGLMPGQIEAIERRAEPSDHITIHAPIGGIVIHKNASEGMYVTAGTRIYTIADLSTVWVKLDAYETDMPWIRFGQEVEFEAESFPGERWKGRISFVDPILDEKTRTVKVRVNVPNPGDLLKPGMFVHGIVRTRFTRGGRVMDPSLAGKWICPMHPEIVKGEPGSCDICGMDLVPSEELGFVSPAAHQEEPLVVPASAVLRTGKRAVVYVRIPDRDKPTFEGRVVVLGPRAGDWYVVRSGISEGEQVVVHGNFKIDSALQIKARSSMMSQPAEGDEPEVPLPFLRSIDPVYRAYFDVEDALFAGDLEKARAAFAAAADRTEAVDMSLVAGELHRRWMDAARHLAAHGAEGREAADLAAARRAFALASDAVLDLEKTFGHLGEDVRFRTRCPMAFGKEAAEWLARTEAVRNPYFGEGTPMETCGTVEDRYPGSGGEVESPSGSALPLEPLYASYFALARALYEDRLDEASKRFGELAALAEGVEDEGLQRVLAASTSGARAAELRAARDAFSVVSRAILGIEQAQGHPGEVTYFRVHCPMARPGGTDWLQPEEEIENPFYGAKDPMASCGEVTERLPGSEGR